MWKTICTVLFYMSVKFYLSNLRKENIEGVLEIRRIFDLR